MIFNRNKNNSYQAYAQSQPTNKGKLILIVSLLTLTIVLIAIASFSKKTNTSLTNSNLKSYSNRTFTVSLPADFELKSIGASTTLGNPDNSESITIGKFLKTDNSTAIEKIRTLTTKGVDGKVITGLISEEGELAGREYLAIKKAGQEDFYIIEQDSVWRISFESEKESQPIFEISQKIIESFTVK